MGLTKKLVSKAVGIHLAHETDEMIWRLVQNLPWGAGDAVDRFAAATTMPVGMPKFRCRRRPPSGT